MNVAQDNVITRFGADHNLGTVTLRAPDSPFVHISDFNPQPKYSKWVGEVAGVLHRPLEGQEPNRFHRFMQRVLLGVKWSKVP
jgi:hypothetical protein